MGRLANVSGRAAAIAFQKAGWVALGQVGSHLVLVKSGVRANLSIPLHKELSVGTLRALIRNAGLTVDEVLDLI
ncbi:MAG: type II toxin-antitoxin system HicA family toxin [Gaiellales bacterium]|nr:type II toxin-antitoxin system HicA family toxin [Gaiellales bacterium]